MIDQSRLYWKINAWLTDVRNYQKAPEEAIEENPIPAVEVWMDGETCLNCETKGCNTHDKYIKHKPHQPCKPQYSSNHSTNDGHECSTAYCLIY